MTLHSEAAFERFTKALGESEGSGSWFPVRQEDINSFADVTHDHQFIHVDPDAAARLSPWGVPIAHGFLTLSLLTHLMASIPQDPARMEGVVMGINYGFDKVRFVSPVKVDSSIRATSVISHVELKGDDLIDTRYVTIEIEGEEKPAVVAQWLTRVIYS
jgi:acyl dehydratase